jgi:undecaprenyl-diphosphatase
MTVPQGLVMGIVQGLTEFLPVSSSGHLAAARHLLHAELATDVGMEVAVHAGTLLAVLIFYRRRLWRIIADAISNRADGRAWLGWLIVGTIPAGVAGLAIKDRVDELFNSLQLVGGGWLITAVLLIVAERLARHSAQTERIGWIRALVIGLGQMVAILPGISRSGSTIATALMTGVQRQRAVDFAFILSLPVVFGAIVLTVPDWVSGAATLDAAVVVGAIAAGISGYVAIAWMIRIVTGGKLVWFAAYCLVLGLVALIFG